MDRLAGVLRCALPVRYWHAMRRGAIVSILLTFILGLAIGTQGVLAYTRRSAETSRKLTSAARDAGTLESDDFDKKQAVLQSGPLLIVSFALATPLGWLTLYLIFSSGFRAMSLAADDPWGDPFLTLLDHLIRGKQNANEARRETEARRRAEGPQIRDRVVTGESLNRTDVDYVVISSRCKDGWTMGTSVHVEAVRLRLAEPFEAQFGGLLRTCYPLKLMNRVEVDRRIVSYEWPQLAPELPALEMEEAVE